ncbi:MAG: hypothetical protein Ct9H90mP6_03930 [Gammaproteobacteria bacterium]|nr:MAG: hypothetical protein Ct9H90mP6_03930 [Gammaproteobacteria bacterium]
MFVQNQLSPEGKRDTSKLSRSSSPENTLSRARQKNLMLNVLIKRGF